MSEKVVSALVIEDDPDDIFLISEFLSESYYYEFEARYAKSLADGKKKIQERAPGIILLDLSLPDAFDFDGLREILNIYPSANIVILTGLSSEKKAIEAVQLGASDYLVKGKIDSKLLSKTIAFSIERKRLQDELRHSQKIEAVGQMAAGIAHNFTNQLTILTLLIMQTKDQVEKPEILNQLEKMESIKDKCVGMTKEILAFSRQQPLKIEKVKAQDLLQRNVELLNVLLGEEVELDIQIKEDCLIQVDQGQFDQVIWNLVFNAKEAIKENGKIEITCSKVKKDNGEEFARIEFRDNGCGMGEEVRIKVLEPFFSTKSQGAGLGLSSVYGIVRKSGGSISIESILGEGSTFTILIPMAQEDVSAVENNKMKRVKI